MTNSRKAPARRVVLRDVAAAAQVSVMTVSNVVHGKRVNVSEETRERVEREIARLHYRPNVIARNLRASSSRSVGFIISDPDPSFLTDPFISQLVSGLSNFLSRADYTLDIQGTPPETFARAGILTKSGNDALCAILCGPPDVRREHRRLLRRTGQPTIIFQDEAGARDADVRVVRQDDLQGGRLIGEHLVERGACRVAFLRMALNWPAIDDRERGLRAALLGADPSVDCETVFSPSESFKVVQDAVRSFLKRRRVDAIAAANDPMGIAAMRVCEELKLKVPQDVRITGFNGFEAWQYATPTLTTVVSPAYELGQHAGELILERLKTGQFTKHPKIFPVQLLVGQSS